MPILKDLNNKKTLGATLALVVFGLTIYFDLLEISGVLAVIFFGRKWLNQIIVLTIKSIWFPLKFLIVAGVVGLLSGVLTFLLALVFSSDASEYISYMHLGRLVVVSILGVIALVGSKYQNDDTNIRSFCRQSLLVGFLILFQFYLGNPERFIQGSFPMDDLMDLTYVVSTLAFYWILYQVIVHWSERFSARYDEWVVRIGRIALLTTLILITDYLSLNWYLKSLYETSVYTDYWVLEMPLKLILIVLIGYFSNGKRNERTKLESLKFKVKAGKTTKLLSVDDILFFQVQYQNTYAITTKQEKVVMEESLSDLEDRLESADFFRLNRQVLAKKEAIQSFEPLTNRKLKVELLTVPDLSAEQEISRLRAPEFKRWVAG